MKEKKYSLAVRKKINISDAFWKEKDFQFNKCEIDTIGGRYWYADPFIFENDNVVYIFFEAFDMIECKGKEGYCILYEDGTCSKPHIVLDEKYHLSFPNIFKYNGNIYMMPEMCGDYSLKLYKATRFPDKWEVCKELLPDVYACDSIIIQQDDKRYLLTNEMFHNVPNNQYSSCWVKNVVYKLNGLDVIDHGTWIKEGDDGIRNAGAIVNNEGKLYRVGQICTNRTYGSGLVLFEIISTEPYEEHFVNRWTVNDFIGHISLSSKNKLIGVHTYNTSEHYEIIDFSYIESVSKKISFKRLLFKYSKLARRILKHFV